MKIVPKEKINELIEKYRQVPDFIGVDLVDIGTKNLYGDQLIHIAAVAGDVNDIELLVCAGADANSKGEDGFTPLHYAAEQGNVDAVKKLIQLGANRKLKNHSNETPRDLADGLGLTDVLNYFDSSEY